jgi:hypothetical protein
MVIEAHRNLKLKAAAVDKHLATFKEVCSASAREIKT